MLKETIILGMYSEPVEQTFGDYERNTKPHCELYACVFHYANHCLMVLVLTCHCDHV